MAQGKFGGGNGLINDPYLIEDIADLNQIRTNPHLHYKLKYSVNAGVIPYNEGNGWNPIENFTGTLDGNGKKVFNLYINRPNEDNVGLFRTFVCNVNSEANTKSRVYDLGFENVNITGRNYVGALLGQFSSHYVGHAQMEFNHNWRFKRIYVTGKVRGSAYVGGLVGRLSFTSAGANNYGSTRWVRRHYNMLKDIYANVEVIASNANTNYAGVVGSLHAPHQYNNSNYNNAAYDIYVELYQLFNNVISNSTFTSSINGLVIHPIYGANEAHQLYSPNVNLFYNKERWNATQVVAVGLSTEEMKRSTYLGTVVEQVNDFDESQRTWTFERGRYPQLYFAIADNLFIKAGEKYYGLDDNGNLELKFTMLPTREEAVEKGIKDISKVSNAIWNSLKEQYETIEIVNIIERSSNVQNVITTHPLDLDDTNSSESKLVYRKEFNFTDFHDGISLIRTV